MKEQIDGVLQSRPNQEQDILNWIKKTGFIDRTISVYELGIFELSARIVGLEKKGYKFNKEPQKRIAKNGRKFRCVKYSLIY